jgi:hypothetical protein
MRQKRDFLLVNELPGVEEVKAMFSQLKKRLNGENITNAAGIMELAAAVEVNNLNDLNAIEDDYQPVCIGPIKRFEVEVEEVHVVREKNSVTKRWERVEKTVVVRKLAISGVFSCKALIKFILLIHVNGFTFALQADGTYRLLDVGWVILVVLFTWNSWEPSKHKVVHHGVPMALELCFTECTQTYTHLFEVSCLQQFLPPCVRRLLINMSSIAQTIANLPITFAEPGVTATQIVPKTLGIDCAVYIANAALAVWAALILVLCWAHIARKFKDKKMKIKHTANVGVVEVHVRAMHNTIAREQFFHLWAFISAHWTTELDEGEYAITFGKSYVGFMTGPAMWRSSWYVTASGMGGISSVSNAIESYNKSIKLLLGVYALYASLAYFFEWSLPKIMTYVFVSLSPNFLCIFYVLLL